MSVFGLDFDYYVGNRRGTAGSTLQSMAVAFERAGAGVSDFSTHIFPRIVKALEKESRRQFVDRGHGPNIGSWAALSVNYAKWKRKHYPGKKLLERTGALRQGLTASNNSFAARFVGKSVLEFGTNNVPYASFHQVGARKRGGGMMPARPPFDFGPDFEGDLFMATRLGVNAAIKQAKLDQYVEEAP